MGEGSDGEEKREKKKNHKRSEEGRKKHNDASKKRAKDPLLVACKKEKSERPVTSSDSTFHRFFSKHFRKGTSPLGVVDLSRSSPLSVGRP